MKIHGIDMEALADLSGLNNYWLSVYDFIESIQNRKLDSLTISQTEWLDKIESEYENMHMKNFL